MRSELSRVSQLRPPERARWSRPVGRRFRRRPRLHVRVRRTPTWVLVSLALLTVLAATSMLTGGGDGDGSRGDLAGAPEVDVSDLVQPRRPAAEERAGRARRDESGGDDDAAGVPPRFARYEQVTLRAPTVEPLGVHFTQGRRVGAVPLRPRGTLTANANPEGFDPSLVDESDDGPEFAVAAPAGRGRPATSAAVISMTAGDWVRAPVSGEVEEVSEYPTADGTDWRLVLSPESRPELHVTLTGLHDPRVEPGDAVEAGETLAAPRLVTDGVAQVGVEMGPAGAPTAMDVDSAGGGGG